MMSDQLFDTINVLIALRGLLKIRTIIFMSFLNQIKRPNGFVKVKI